MLKDKEGQLISLLKAFHVATYDVAIDDKAVGNIANSYVQRIENILGVEVLPVAMSSVKEYNFEFFILIADSNGHGYIKTLQCILNLSQIEAFHVDDDIKGIVANLVSDSVVVIADNVEQPYILLDNLYNAFQDALSS